MTSYSLYFGHDESADERRDYRCETFVMGAARCLLGSFTTIQDPGKDDDDPPAEAQAEWWHSAARGWELDALHPDDRREFRHRVEGFFDVAYDDLEVVLALIRERENHWASPARRAWYRAGMLLPHTANGSGVGFWEYGDAGRRVTDAADRAGEFHAWCTPTYDRDQYAHLS